MKRWKIWHKRLNKLADRAKLDSNESLALMLALLSWTCFEDNRLTNIIAAYNFSRFFVQTSPNMKNLMELFLQSDEAKHEIISEN